MKITGLNNKCQQQVSRYIEELLKWNKTHNLIGKTTESEIISRHIEDSLQIIKLIPDGAKLIYDFGSGAGLPAVVLAIYFNSEGSDIKVEAFESNNKKASFLNYIKTNLKLSNFVVNAFRIEDCKPNIKADIITARAFSSLENIFNVSTHYIHKNTKFILHKGININSEIKEARKSYKFDFKLHSSDLGGGFIFESEIPLKQ